MKSWPRSLRSAVNSLACLAVGVVLCHSAIALAQGSAPAVLYTASDFPALADGVDTGLAGDVDVQVWAPSQDEWSLTQGRRCDHAETPEQARRPDSPMEVPGQGQPRERPAAQDRRSRSDSAEVKIETKPQRKSAQSTERTIRPVPALLWLTASTDPGASPDLDFVRGRIETIKPSPDRRRTEVADQLGRRRLPGARDGRGLARPCPAPPRTAPGDPGPLADVPQDADEPPGLRQAHARRLHDREGRPRDASRLHAQRQPLSADRRDRQDTGHPLPARPLGGRPHESRGPAALHPLGEAGLRRVHV